jgi:hypothetical protein
MSRASVDWRSVSKKNYSLFCKTHTEVKLTYTEWITIIYEFNESYKEYLLETGLKGKITGGLGEFAIKKKKRRRTKGKNDEYINLPIDWQKTKEKGKRIYNLNYDTEGFFFGWWWFKPTASFKFKELWYFKPTRLTSRLITHYVRADVNYQHMYREWEDNTLKNKVR